MSKKEENNLKKEFRTQLSVMISSAFALTAALFWKDAITEFITSSSGLGISAEGSWIALSIVAVLITVVAVIAMWLVNKTLKPKEEEE